MCVCVDVLAGGDGGDDNDDDHHLHPNIRSVVFFSVFIRDEHEDAGF